MATALLLSCHLTSPNNHAFLKSVFVCRNARSLRHYCAFPYSLLYYLTPLSVCSRVLHFSSINVCWFRGFSFIAHFFYPAVRILRIFFFFHLPIHPFCCQSLQNADLNIPYSTHGRKFMISTHTSARLSACQVYHTLFSLIRSSFDTIVSLSCCFGERCL